MSCRLIYAPPSPPGPLGSHEVVIVSLELVTLDEHCDTLLQVTLSAPERLPGETINRHKARVQREQQAAREDALRKIGRIREWVLGRKWKRLAEIALVPGM